MKNFALFVLVTTLVLCLGIWIGGSIKPMSTDNEIPPVSWSLAEQGRSEIPELRNASKQEVDNYTSAVLRSNLIYSLYANDDELLARETEGLIKLAQDNAAKTTNPEVLQLYNEYRETMQENLTVLKEKS